MTLVFAGFQLSIVRIDPAEQPRALERVLEAQRLEQHIQAERLKTLRIALTTPLSRFLQ